MRPILDSSEMGKRGASFFLASQPARQSAVSFIFFFLASNAVHFFRLTSQRIVFPLFFFFSLDTSWNKYLPFFCQVRWVKCPILSQCWKKVSEAPNTLCTLFSTYSRYCHDVRPKTCLYFEHVCSHAFTCDSALVCLVIPTMTQKNSIKHEI